MKTDQSLIRELSAKVDRMERELRRLDARPAQPKAARLGWWMGVLQGSLAAQGTATVKIIVWDAGAAAWKYMDPVRTVTVRDFWLNSGETIDANTRIRIDWYRNVWTWSQAYCAAADNLPA